MRCKLVNAMGSDEFRGNNNNLENFEIATVNETSLSKSSELHRGRAFETRND